MPLKGLWSSNPNRLGFSFFEFFAGTQRAQSTDFLEWSQANPSVVRTLRMPAECHDAFAK